MLAESRPIKVGKHSLHLDIGRRGNESFVGLRFGGAIGRRREVGSDELVIDRSEIDKVWANFRGEITG